MTFGSLFAGIGGLDRNCLDCLGFGEIPKKVID